MCNSILSPPLSITFCQMFGSRLTPSARPSLLIFHIDCPIARISSPLALYRVPRSGMTCVTKRSPNVPCPLQVRWCAIHFILWAARRRSFDVCTYCSSCSSSFMCHCMCVKTCSFSTMANHLILLVQFGVIWIKDLDKRGQIAWPARSPDLTPLDCFLRGHMKNLVHETDVYSEKDLLAWDMAAADVGLPGIGDREHGTVPAAGILVFCTENKCLLMPLFH